jgi:acetyl-CoA carboxylase carboxyl transferase subunit alpha
MVVGTQKGRDTKENILRNFGSAHPEGYRKALRLMRLADKFSLPIVTVIDTAGAYPGIGAEERHIAEAIAVNLREMTLLDVPIIAVWRWQFTGGALVWRGGPVLILENAYFDYRPELRGDPLEGPGCRSKAPCTLKITTKDLTINSLTLSSPNPRQRALIRKDGRIAQRHLLKHLQNYLPARDKRLSNDEKNRAFSRFQKTGDGKKVSRRQSNEHRPRPRRQ